MGDVGPNVFGGGGVLGTGVGATPKIKPGTSEMLQSQLAVELYGQTQPIREDLIAQLLNAVQGTGDFPDYLNPAREAIDTQFAGAKDNLIASLPSGGGLSEALTDLESSRAQSIGGLVADDTQQRLSQAFGLAFSTAPAALGPSAASEAQRRMAQAQAESAKGQGLGQLVGMGVGALVGGPPGALIGGSIGGKAGGGLPSAQATPLGPIINPYTGGVQGGL